MSNNITVIGGLVNTPELFVSKNGTPYTRFSIAQSESVRGDDGNYTEVGPVYWNIALFKGRAEAFCASNIPRGTRLMVTGRLSVEHKPAYQTKSGQYVEERDEAVIVPSDIAVVVGYGRTVAVGKLDKNAQPTNSADVTQSTNTASEPKVAPVKPAEKSVPNNDFLADDDIFGTSTLNDDDIFG